MDLSEAIRHPVALASGVTSAVVGLVGSVAQVPVVPELTAWLATNALQMFSGVSVFAFTVAPEMELPPVVADGLQSVAIVLAVLAGVKRLIPPLRNLKERFS